MAHIPTDEWRAEVRALKSFGVSHEMIARHLKIDEDTLAKHYRDDLDTAVVNANAMVAGKLFKKATVDEDLTAIIFWLKTRARWRTADKEDDRKLESVVEKLVDKLTQK